MNLFASNISVPRLQRDYVQGAHQKKIIPFVKSLLDVSTNVDLNYIYGTIDKDGSFLPIDGQQRLTTIWLVKLCLHKSLGLPFDISLKYQAREYANNFSDKLLDASLNDLKNPSRAPWFVKAWNDDPSVCAMCSAIAVIWQLLPTDISGITHIYNSFDSHLKSCHLPLDENINEDVYIKMNRRGLQLTAFENLKSWLDKKVEDISISKKWKQAMDGEWTNMMWDIIDKSDLEKNLSIDDLMLNCIYSFAFIYLSKNKTEFNKRFVGKENEEIAKDACFILGLENIEDIADACLNRIGEPVEKMRFALYELETLPIFTDESMTFILGCMNRLYNTYDRINKSEIRLFSKPSPENVTVIERLINENTYQSRTMLYALCVFEGSDSTTFESWIYRIRNLVVNTTIDASSIDSVLDGIDTLNDKCSVESVNDVLHFDKDDENHMHPPRINGFNRDQLQEECLKSELSPEVWEEVKSTENHPFFLGRVSFLFDFAGHHPSYESLKPYSYYMCKFFGEDSFTYGMGNSLRFSMFSYGWFGYSGQYGNWSFLKSLKEKKDFIYDNTVSKDDYLRNEPHNDVLKLLIDALYNQYGCEAPTPKKIELIGKSQYETICKEDSRRYFSDIGIWNYMQQHQLRYISPTKQFLFEKTKGNCNHINLWNHFLYLLWAEKHSKILPEWNFNKWSDGDESCVYFDKHTSKETKLAIDIWHDDTKYGWYNMSIFFREDANLTEKSLGPVLSICSPKYIFREDRFVTSESISLENLEDYLRKMNRVLNKEFQNL